MNFKEVLLNPALIGLISLFLTGAGGLIGYGFRYQLDKQKELQSEVNRERREVYQKLVNLTVDLFMSGKKADSLGADDLDTVRLKLIEIYKKEMLYASPEVVNAFGDFMQLAYRTNDTPGLEVSPFDVIASLTNLIGAMRTDLGLSNSDLGSSNERLLRPIITDFDQGFQ